MIRKKMIGLACLLSFSGWILASHAFAITVDDTFTYEGDDYNIYYGIEVTGPYGSEEGDGYWYYNSPGEYQMTVEGNNSPGLVEALIQEYIDPDFEVSSNGKYEYDGGDVGGDTPLYLDFHYSSVENENDGTTYSGTWATYDDPAWDTGVVPQNWQYGDEPAPAEDETTLDFSVVKGGNYFSLYLLDPSVSAGTWNTEGLPKMGGNNSLTSFSHYSGYSGGDGGGGGGTGDPIPEPGTMLLFGTGLFGLGAFLRRKRQ
ncbi:MAG: PEP-CTERM sorting domain-containing protein [Desulfurivibrionaceae bacterium]